MVTAKGKGSWLLLKKIDLTGINQISFAATLLEEAQAGLIEIRLGSPTGKLIGQAETNAVQGNKSTAPKATIDKQAGFTDIYIVFVNKNAVDEDQFLRLRVLHFMMGVMNRQNNSLLILSTRNETCILPEVVKRG